MVERLIDMIKKVKRATALTIERTAKEVRLTTDTGILRELLSCLDQERGTEFYGELVSALRVYFSTVHRSRIQLAEDNALKRFHALLLSWTLDWLICH